ncbi:MAG: hypothetical protein GY711_19860 [bacterium]|nr:hypothetical protein [bacterium]
MGDLQLDPAQAHAPVEVVLEGSGTIEGTVHDPNGTPLRGWWLWALPPSDPDEPRTGPFDARTHLPLEYEGGLHDTYAVTDSEGRFRLTTTERGETARLEHTIAAGDYLVEGELEPDYSIMGSGSATGATCRRRGA